MIGVNRRTFPTRTHGLPDSRKNSRKQTFCRGCLFPPKFARTNERTDEGVTSWMEEGEKREGPIDSQPFQQSDRTSSNRSPGTLFSWAPLRGGLARVRGFYYFVDPNSRSSGSLRTAGGPFSSSSANPLSTWRRREAKKERREETKTSLPESTLT